MAFLTFVHSFTLIITTSLLHHHTSITAYTLTPADSIVDGQTLISQASKFELGFFNLSDSPNRYLGIWYKSILHQTIVWVANRDSPLNHSSGLLRITATGNILIFSDPQSVIWSSNSSKLGANPVLEFLESGNLVVRDVRNGGEYDSGSYLWQSFDHPGNTLLPGAKLGRSLNTGINRYLSSWRSSDDPSYGGFTYGMDLEGYLETVLRNGSRKYYRGGPWNGVRHSGAPDLKINPIFTYEVVHNDDEIYYMYRLVNQSLIMRSVLMQTSPASEAHLQLLTWVDKANEWVRLVSIPRDRCDDYALCGVYSTCDVMNVAVCKCLEGFKPKSPQEWSRTDWSQGCEREASLNCSVGDGFLKYSGVRLPDTNGTWVNTSMNLQECRVNCVMNCTCTAYTNTDIRGGGSGCIMWFGDLIDIRQLRDAGQDIFIRMAASELDSISNSRTKRLAIIVASIALLAGMVALGLGIRFIWKKKSLKGLECWYGWNKKSRKDNSERDDLELPLYDWVTILNATNNFLDANKLGEGGFGPVYKGKLEGDKQIAVKRLSQGSRQGCIEFKNEVLLISKLQHRNLVRLLGYCIHGEEKILVYEYMQNKSLDSSIFDERKSRLLDWNKRYQIILGIARGLVYLHHDSRLRIIHRDLKASNILLDGEMVPKISDFGMARLFGGNQIEEKTKRVVGTYGYMAPEYALDGKFSVKSDVFSFGILVLEVISGKKNRSFYHPDHGHNLAGHQKVVIQVAGMKDGKSRTKAMRIAVSVQGVVSAELQGAEKNQIVVVGEEIDSTHLTMLIRKKVGFTELVSVTSIPEKKEEKKETKSDVSVQPLVIWSSHQQYGTPPIYFSEDYHHDQDNCALM